MVDATGAESTSEEAARWRDSADALTHFREQFYVPQGKIYLDGNSLGLLSRPAEAAILAALEDWKQQGIDGWLAADPPWYHLCESLAGQIAPLVGATPDEICVTGSTTMNLHQLVATLYQPIGDRRKIVALALDFPSDLYALQSQLHVHSGNPADLILIDSPDQDGMIAEDAIEAALGPDVALLVMSTVLYRSGQLFDCQRLATAARRCGATIILDASHSAGAIPHHFDAWGIDAAVWCSYKYLNGGPGATACLYLNRRHFGRRPALAGWWGSHKDRQFDLTPHFQPAQDAGAWQVGTPAILATVALRGSLAIVASAGIERIRAKSLALTTYVIDLVEEWGLTAASDNITIGTPRQQGRRGGHVALNHPDAARLCKALKGRGVIPDFRPPQTIRLAPVALYTSFHDVWSAITQLREILETAEHERFAEGRDVVA